MATNANQFNAELEVFARGQVPEDVAALKREVAGELLEGAVERTPVLTGFHRGQWGVSLDVPFTGRRPPDKDGSATIAAGKAVIAGARPSGGHIPDIHIGNNGPAIGDLENGTSDKAPQGILGITVEEVRARHP